MRLSLWAAGVLLVAVTFAACGGGGGKSDEQAIEDLFKDAAAAINDADFGKLAGLASKDCGDVAASVAADFEESEALGMDFQIEVTGVDIRNLEEESAEALVRGKAVFDGEEERLEADGEYVQVAKEDGEWKVGDCDFFGSGAGESP